MSDPNLVPHTVDFGRGRRVTRNLPPTASPAQIRAAFAQEYIRRGFDPSQIRIAPPQPATPSTSLVPGKGYVPPPRNALPGQGEIKSRETGWAEGLRNRISDFGSAIGAPILGERMANEAAYVPGLGDAAMAAEAGDAFSQGRPASGLGLTLLAALGVVPGAGDAAASGIRKAFSMGRSAGAEAAVPIRAYHGSPYEFDRFSLSHIGRGEGNQAFGNGLYFAEKPGVAGSYAVPRSNEALRDVPTEIKAPLFQELRRNGYLGFDTPGEAIQAMRGHPDWATRWEPVDAKRLGGLFNTYNQHRFVPGMRPSLYEVNLKTNPHRLIDWDQSVSNQGHRVRAAADNLGFAPTATGKTVVNSLGPRGPERLANHGIDGVRFFDGGSRSAGSGSRNYVMFDDSLIEIARKYGIALPAAAGVGALTVGASQQPAQGQGY